MNRRAAAVAVLAVLTATTGGIAARQFARAHGATQTTPVLVGIRAAHHPSFDRIVFQFAGALPSRRRVDYVGRLIADPSGQTVSIAGRAILRVSLYPATAHNAAGHATARGGSAFALPNVISVVRAGDFESVISYGVGLAKRSSVHVFTLTRPSRVVIDIATRFRTVLKRVYFFNERNFKANRRPFVSAVVRPVLPGTPATGVMDRLFAGPTATEYARGLRLVQSKATGYTSLAISAGVASFKLTGACSSSGSTVSIADEIFPTLKQLPGVRNVKLFDPAGHTEAPRGNNDSRPFCLEP
jgi:hypothetical protein